MNHVLTPRERAAANTLRAIHEAQAARVTARTAAALVFGTTRAKLDSAAQLLARAGALLDEVFRELGVGDA